MKTLLGSFLLLFTICSLHAQDDGKIIQKTDLILPDSVRTTIKARLDGQAADKILQLRFSKITYLSDGLKVIAYLVEPKEEGKYPCIISNRGGNRDFGQWSPLSIALFLGSMASWDYVVIASQYRGNDGGEGLEEFGGNEIHDVLNLIPVLAQIPNADTSRIGMEGMSRGGMMTYLALARTCQIKAAATTGAVANAFTTITARPEMEDVFGALAVNYSTDKENCLQARSAVFWADKICKTTPLLIMHGSADWRVTPAESLELINKLYEYRHPVRFILFEGADHGISEYRKQRLAEIRRHFDYYVRDRQPLPNMVPHGR